MTRHLTWTCPDCGETNECTDAACECQWDADHAEIGIEAIYAEYIEGELSFLEAVSRLHAIGEDEAERVVNEWAEGQKCEATR